MVQWPQGWRSRFLVHWWHSWNFYTDRFECGQIFVRKEVMKIVIISIFSGFSKVAQLLIQNSADVNVIGRDRKTALMHGAEKGKTHFHRIQCIC